MSSGNNINKSPKLPFWPVSSTRKWLGKPYFHIPWSFTIFLNKPPLNLHFSYLSPGPLLLSLFKKKKKSFLESLPLRKKKKERVETFTLSCLVSAHIQLNSAWIHSTFQSHQDNFAHNVIFSVCENRLLVKQMGEEGSEQSFWSYEIIENLFWWSNQGTWKLVGKKRILQFLMSS